MTTGLLEELSAVSGQSRNEVRSWIDRFGTESRVNLAAGRCVELPGVGQFVLSAEGIRFAPDPRLNMGLNAVYADLAPEPTDPVERREWIPSPPAPPESVPTDRAPSLQGTTPGDSTEGFAARREAPAPPDASVPSILSLDDVRRGGHTVGDRAADGALASDDGPPGDLAAGVTRPEPVPGKAADPGGPEPLRSGDAGEGPASRIPPSRPHFQPVTDESSAAEQPSSETDISDRSQTRTSGPGERARSRAGGTASREQGRSSAATATADRSSHRERTDRLRRRHRGWVRARLTWVSSMVAMAIAVTALALWLIGRPPEPFSESDIEEPSARHAAPSRSTQPGPLGEAGTPEALVQDPAQSGTSRLRVQEQPLEGAENNRLAVDAEASRDSDATPAIEPATGAVSTDGETNRPSVGLEAVWAPGSIDRTGGGYALVIASESTFERAAARASAEHETWSPKGLIVDVLTVRSGETDRYRVALGRFDSIEAADRARQELASELPTGTWVLRIRTTM